MCDPRLHADNERQAGEELTGWGDDGGDGDGEEEMDEDELTAQRRAWIAKAKQARPTVSAQKRNENDFF